tara:strand:+ start:337 stop:2556 length:2220 start_codon:yes stop_codon:yes gene_type:complete
MRSYPQTNVLEKEKTPEWCKLFLDYSQDLLKSSDYNRSLMDESFKSYNGIKTPESILYLTKTYGIQNRAKFIPYRAHSTKIKLMVGEFLTRPLNATVTTINRDAKSAKMDQLDFMYGAMEAKKELIDLKNKAGVDVMEGAPIPDGEEDPIFQKMSPKDKEESIMQIILNEQIPTLDLKQKFSNDLLNCSIASMIYGKVERDEEGETRYISVDPRDAIYEEIDGDTFLEKSPIMGCRQWMSIHDVMRRYNFDTKQLEMLKDIANNPQSYANASNNRIRYSPNGGLVVEVIHIEWKSVTASYFKKMPKTVTQLAFDPSEKFIFTEIDAKNYEDNKEWHDIQVQKGKYEVEVRYAEDLWEATRIGGLEKLDVNMRRSYFIMRSVDEPGKVLSSSYTGFLCGTVDGKRISLMNEMENWSNIFDIVMYQILKDINKHKGTILGFNTAALGAKNTVKKINYDIVNDGFVTYDTSASGNFHGRDVSLNNILQTHDLGLSSSFGALVQFKNDILVMMDRMTGINNDREGQIQASSTATNTNSAIQASRTMTEPFFYGVYLYINKTLTKIVESTKITWAFYKLEKGEQILGVSKFKFLKVSQEIGYKDYGVHLEDSGKYAEVKQFMRDQLNASLNAKEIRPEDALAFVWSDIASEQRAILKEGWAKIKELEGQNQQAQMQNQQQMQAAQLQQQIELANADREDKQAHDLEKIVLQGDTDIRVNQNKMSDQVIVNQNKFDNENINNANI